MFQLKTQGCQVFSRLERSGVVSTKWRRPPGLLSLLVKSIENSRLSTRHKQPLAFNKSQLSKRRRCNAGKSLCTFIYRVKQPDGFLGTKYSLFVKVELLIIRTKCSLRSSSTRLNQCLICLRCVLKCLIPPPRWYLCYYTLKQ